MVLVLQIHESNHLGNLLCDFGNWPMTAWKHWLQCQYLDEKSCNGPVDFWLLLQACEGGRRGKETGKPRVEHFTTSFTTSPISWSRNCGPPYLHSPHLLFHSSHTCTNTCTSASTVLATQKEIQKEALKDRSYFLLDCQLSLFTCKDHA